MAMRHENAIYRLKPPDWCFTADGARVIPIVSCEFCGQRVSGFLNLPLVPSQPFERWIVPFDSFPYPEISYSEFLTIQSLARTYLKEPAELVPMAALGPFEIQNLGVPDAVLKEIEYAEPGGFLFSQNLLSQLVERGFELPHQPVTLKDRRQRNKEFGLIQFDAIRLPFHERTLEEDHLSVCRHCGTSWRHTNPAAKPSDMTYLDRKYQHIAGDFFTFAPDAGCICLSERAFATLNELNPTGYAANLAGEWLD